MRLAIRYALLPIPMLACSAADAFADDPYRASRWITASPRPDLVRVYRRQQVYNWTGYYIGASVGGAVSSTAFDWTANPAGFPISAADLVAASIGSAGASSAIGGGEIGVNLQAGSFVVGLEADYGFLHLKHTRTDNLARFGYANSPLEESVDIDGIATVRGRLGYAFDRLLIYGTAGIAFAHLNYRDAVFFGSTATTNGVSRDIWENGVVFGGGVEWALGKNWTTKVSYLHTEIAPTTLFSTNSNAIVFPSSTIAHHHADTKIDMLRLGLDYKFGN